MFPELFEAMDATMDGLRLVLGGGATQQDAERAYSRIAAAQQALHRSQGVGDTPHQHTAPPAGGPPA